MHRGFNIEFPAGKNLFTEFFISGKKLYEQKESLVERYLDNFKGINGRLDGSKLQANWFPPVEADIFLSHSHKDRDQAIALSG